MSIANIELEQDRMRLGVPAQVMLLVSRVVASVRRKVIVHRRMQMLRALPDHLLIDIGVDPASVRDDLFATPEQYPLLVSNQGGR